MFRQSSYLIPVKKLQTIKKDILEYHTYLMINLYTINYLNLCVVVISVCVCVCVHTELSCSLKNHTVLVLTGEF